MPAPSPPALPAGLGARLQFGARAAVKGMAFPFHHPSLLGLVALVLLSYSAVWLLLLGLAAKYDQLLVDWLVAPSGPEWWARALTALATGAAYVLTWLAALFAASALALPLCGPLLSLLADRVEHCAMGQTGPMPPWTALLPEMARGMVRGLTLSLLLTVGNAWIWLAGAALGAVLPPLGAVFAFLVGALWQALGAATMTASYVLENQRTSLADQLAALQRNAAIWVGFGAVALPLCWIPVGVPLAVTGATLLALQLHQMGQLRMPARESAVSSAET